MKKIVLTLSFIAVFNPISFAQTTPKTTPGSSTQPSSYAYVRIKGKAFSKKLKVEVDFGDSQEQLDKGEKFSEILTNKKSYAAVLN